MPEDCIIIFKATETTKATTLADRLAQDIVQRSIMEYFDDTKADSQPEAQMSDADWDGNVPPDLVDGFDFLL